MKKKRCLYYIFLFILLPFVCAVDEDAINEELIYSDDVYSGQTVNISGETFTFSLSTSNDRLSVKLPSGLGIILKNKSCEIRDNYDICFTGTEFWYHNYTLDWDFYKASVKIYVVLSEIELTKTVDKTNPLIGEETKIDLTIKNTGDREATNIIFSDNIPSSFAITDISGCSIEDNNIKWYGSLDKNLEKKCSYKIKALSKTTFNSKASLKYNDGVKLVQLYSDTQTITVPDYQLNISIELDKNNTEIGQNINLDITLTNVNNEKDISVELFSITIPYGLKVTTVPRYLNQDFNKYFWKGTLSKEESTSFNFKLKGEFVNNYTLRPKASFIINSLRKEIEKPTYINVYTPSLSIDYRINKAVLRSSEKANIVIEIKNPSTIHSFKDIELVIESELPGIEKITKKLDRLKPLESKKVSDLSFTAPDVEARKEYTINISLNYESDYNQVLRLKEEKTVTVIRKGEIVGPVINETNITEIEEKENVSLVEENITQQGGESKIKKYASTIFFIVIIIGIFFIIILIFIFIHATKRIKKFLTHKKIKKEPKGLEKIKDKIKKIEKERKRKKNAKKEEPKEKIEEIIKTMKEKKERKKEEKPEELIKTGVEGKKEVRKEKIKEEKPKKEEKKEKVKKEKVEEEFKELKEEKGFRF